MTRIRIFLAPLALLLIGAAPPFDGLTASGNLPSWPGWRSPPWRQVRIEQRFSIRITPGTAAMPPSVVEEIEQEERTVRVEQRKVGKCLAINSIATLEPGDGDELLLFLHDDRIISANLEKRCSARDFYSGFYIVGNADGAICTGRDILHSRSGDNCKVRRLHELVPARYRRFP